METTTKPDVYAIVTNRILEQLKTGAVPWKKPWREAGIPQNFITKRPYRGINLLLLGTLTYPHHQYLTFEQAQSIGAQVKRGEKGHLVVFWKKKETKPDEMDVEAEPRTRIVLRYYMVFNIAQCHNIPKEKLPVREELSQAERLDECEKVLCGMPEPPHIKFGHYGAFYDHIEDTVLMPDLEEFNSSEAFYDTLFHELVHSTGHPKRLNRASLSDAASMKSESYSFEELVAEIGGMFLTSICGIGQSQFENNMAYIQGWLTRLQDEPRWIISASGQAQKAVDHILNVKPTPHEQAEETPPQP